METLTQVLALAAAVVNLCAGEVMLILAVLKSARKDDEGRR